MFQGFWKNIRKPIIGLSPMDGVTDAAFRYVTAKYGKPDIQITEFTSAEGLAAGAVKLLDDFIYDEIERPVLAQIFGSSPEAFYKAAVLVCAMGFDGLDINMGCPARNVAEHGGGAALIRTPKLAQELIGAAQKGVKDWMEGIGLEEAEVHPDIITAVKNGTRYPAFKVPGTVFESRMEIPVSVKTRVGYDAIVIEDWVKYLLETKPVAISIHGRTLKQLYSGPADWEAIGRAAQIIKQTETVTLGNGDIVDLADAKNKIARYGVDGVLIGRAAFGNPWVFREENGTGYSQKNTRYLPLALADKLAVAVEHARYFENVLPRKNFLHMRKHLGWYVAGFDGAKELRAMLMKPEIICAQDVEKVINGFCKYPQLAHTVPMVSVVG